MEKYTDTKIEDVDDLEDLELEYEDKNEEVDKKNEVKSILTYLWHMVLLAAAILTIGSVFNHFFTLNYIPSESMETTIMTRDIIIASKFDIDQIKRYDIIIFRATDTDDDEELMIKRVIGLPGDTVVVKEGQVYVNGKLTNDSFVNEMVETDGDGEYKVPDGCYFVMGDNRDMSLDSRFWENKYVPKDYIIAKAKVCVYPVSHIKKIK